MTRNLSTILLALAVAAFAAAPAGAAKRFTIRGAGYGHGVGMSQYGAMGYAANGWDYRRILGHYYTDTSIGVLNEPRTVRVLLQSLSGSAAFTGATRAAGRRLTPTATYRVRGRAGGLVQLLNSRGREITTVPAPLRATGPGPLTLKGTSGFARRDGAYRGALEFRPGTFGGINAINAVGIDDYVQGVVPLESPASWPIEALKAQAVAARTYALTTTKSGAGFEHYPDTRSQVYGGVGAEQPSTSAATQATAGQLVTYNGAPVATYFFSTSGGRTEAVENSALGTKPLPWLTSVEDEYDEVSPRHRWGPIKLTMAGAAAKLRGYVRGRFKGIDVIQRGRSPRIVAADVVGSGGRVRVSGATLRAELGLYDTWAYFTSIKTGRAPAPLPTETPDPDEPVIARVPDVAGLSGTVMPARKGALVRVELRFRGRWVPAGETTTDRRGRYHAGVSTAGLYRVRYRGNAGPGVRVG
jgi:stage II sporulation protein D